MKRYVIAICLGLSAIVYIGTACKTTTIVPATIKTEGVIITTVDTGMKGWAIYVNSGKATQSQVDAVHKAYDTYYNAQVIAETALVTYLSSGSTNGIDISSANTSVANAETALLNILNQYIK